MKIKPADKTRGTERVESQATSEAGHQRPPVPAGAVRSGERGDAEFRAIVDEIATRYREGGVAIKEAVGEIARRYVDWRWKGVGSKLRGRIKKGIGNQVRGDPLMVGLFRRIAGR